MTDSSVSTEDTRWRHLDTAVLRTLAVAFVLCIEFFLSAADGHGSDLLTVLIAGLCLATTTPWRPV